MEFQLLTTFGKITQYTWPLVFLTAWLGPTGAFFQPNEGRRDEIPPQWKECLFHWTSKGGFPVNKCCLKKTMRSCPALKQTYFGTPKIHQSIQISLPSVGAADATKILKTTCVGPCPLFWFVKNLEVRVSQMYFFSSSNHQMQKGNLSLGYEFCWCRKTWGRTLLESVDYFLKVDQQNRDIELGCSSWWGFSSAGRVEVSRDPWFFEDQKSTSTFQCNHIPSFFWNWIFVWASNRLESCYECEQLKWFAAYGLASRFQLRHDLERLYCGYRCLGVVVCWSGSRFGGLYPIFICIWKV